MASHIVGYPRIGPKRELTVALDSYFERKSSTEELKKVAADLRLSIWKQMDDAGIKHIPSNTFTLWDLVLDTIAMLGSVPPRYGWNGGEIGLDTYFSMARGNANVPAMEMARWFNTLYYYTVPELGPDVNFSYASKKAVTEYKEAKERGVDTIPVIIGPVSFLLLSKPAKGVEKNFDLLSLLGKILPIYKEVISDLKAAGASWIQFDEPTIVLDLDSHKLKAFTDAYSELESSLSGLNVLMETYFADIPAAAYKTLTALKGVTALGFDLVRGTKTLDLIKREFPKGKYLFAGVVDGRNIWANDLAASLRKLHALEDIVGQDKLVVSTSCSLLHIPVDLANETMFNQEFKSWPAFAAQNAVEVANEIKFHKEFKSWLAFAAQKVVEVNALAKALAGQKDDAFFSANAAAQASRRSSPRGTNEVVETAAAALKDSDHWRATNVSARLDAQRKLVVLIPLSTPMWSTHQIIELAKPRRDYHEKKISKDEYLKAVEEEVKKVHKIGEGDTGLVVHGKAERNDMVEYFGENLPGLAFTSNGWVQLHGSLCGKPPIIYGTVNRPNPMTVSLNSAAQRMAVHSVLAVLPGPITILNYSFVRDDKPRRETCYQIALAIKGEVEDLEKAGINAIQIEETSFRVGLPLRKSEQAFYLDWAARCFRVTNSGVRDATQIHTHIGYTKLDDIIPTINDMDADVITVGNSRFDEKLFSVFWEGFKYGAGIGRILCCNDSSGRPSAEEIADRVSKMLAELEPNISWFHPHFGPKTHKYTEVNLALKNMATAVKVLHPKLVGNSCCDEKHFSAFRRGVKYGAGDPVLHCNDSSGRPSAEEIAYLVSKMLAELAELEHPNFGPKTRKDTEVKVLHPKLQGPPDFQLSGGKSSK